MTLASRTYSGWSVIRSLALAIFILSAMVFVSGATFAQDDPDQPPALPVPPSAGAGTSTSPISSPTMDQNGSLTSLPPSSVISSGTVNSEYVLGPGDIMNVLVQPQTKYGLTQAAIEQNGQFEYPHIGTLNASGKTVSELRDEIVADLSRYCVNPDVTIEVTALRPQVIYVTGGVKTPKILDVRAAPNVAKAITLADGATDTAELAHVTVFRDGKLIPANVYGELVNGTDTGQNIDLMPGDLVVVPMNTAKFAVVGAVLKPGIYPITPSGGNEGQTRLADALAAANGAERSGASIHSIQVVRTLPDGTTKTYFYDYGKYVKSADTTQNPIIQDKDLIFVPDSKHNFNPLDTLGYIPYLAVIKGMGL